MATYKVTNLTIGLQAGTTDKASASWSFSSKTAHFDHYAVKWWYTTSNGKTYEGSTESIGSINNKVALYSIPAIATGIKVRVTPVATTNSDTKKAYWTGEGVYKTWSKTLPPNKPTLEDPVLNSNYTTATVTATINREDLIRTDKIRFYLVDADNRSVIEQTKDVKPDALTLKATASFSLTSNNKYVFLAKAINVQGKVNKLSAYSDATKAFYSALSRVENVSSTILPNKNVKFTWKALKTIQNGDQESGYILEYTTNKTDFINGTAEQVTVHTNSAELSLNYGIYYVRVRAYKSIDGNDVVGAWSGDGTKQYPYHVRKLSKDPYPPTVWTNVNRVTSPNPFIVSFVHNSADGSTWKRARIILSNEEHTETIDVTNPDQYAEDQSYSREIRPTLYGLYADSVIQVRVATQSLWDDGAFDPSDDQFNDPVEVEFIRIPSYSVSLQSPGYDPDTLELKQLPLTVVYFESGGVSLLGMNVTVSANNAYPDVNALGEAQFISEGEIIYSKYHSYPSDESWSGGSYAPWPNYYDYLRIKSTELKLKTGISYSITLESHFVNGLTDQRTIDFTSAVEPPDYTFSGTVVYDPETMGATIDVWSYYYTDQMDVATINGLFVDYFQGLTADMVYSGQLTYPDVDISVYRIQPDGDMILIDSGLQSNGTSAFDPHPALDVARYRVVVTDNATGYIDYTDIESEPIGEYNLVFQWDENYISGREIIDEEYEVPVATGKILKLPFNINISESHDMEVQNVNYIGRKHPVSYYGTQTGEKASWSTDVPKTDTESLALLREMAVYPGNFYVREPNGNGYWANIKVSYSINYDSVVIPVSVDITRVEGGA